MYLKGSVTDFNPTDSPPATIAEDGALIVFNKALATEFEKSDTPYRVPATNPSQNGFNIKLIIPLTRFVTIENASKLESAFPAIDILDPKLLCNCCTTQSTTSSAVPLILAYKGEIGISKLQNELNFNNPLKKSSIFKPSES